MSVNKESRIPFKRAVAWIVLSVFVFTGPALLALKHWLSIKDLKATDPRYAIVALVQIPQGNSALATAQLAELLNLQADRPNHLYVFSGLLAEKHLLATHLFDAVKIKKILPGTLFIEYLLKTPWAFLGDFENTVIDQNGHSFPFKPYFTPKHLPIFYLGCAKTEPLSFQWGDPLPGERLDLASQIFKELQSRELNVERIDVSAAFSEASGEREIVVVLKEPFGKIASEKKTILLRFDPNQWRDGLKRYLLLKEHCHGPNSTFDSGCALAKDPEFLAGTVLDFRVSQLALIDRQL